MYLPPRPSVRRNEAAYQRCVREILGWVDSVCARQPARVSSVLGGDFNDHAGIQRDGGTPVDPAMDPVGPLAPRQEHFAMKQIRELLGKYGLCLLNTFVGGHDTYYGHRGSTRIDYIAAPRSWLRSISHS
eukprot:2425046-Pyramimonas_sp.AAC.1